LKRQNIRTLATFAPLELGDTILATPLYKALRATYPDARITVLSQLRNHPVLDGSSDFDSVVDYEPNADLSMFDLIVLPVLCGDNGIREHFDSYPNVISADRKYASKRQSIINKWNGRYSHVLFYKHQVEMNRELAYEAGYAGPSISPYCPQGDSNRFQQYREKIGLFINAPTNDFQAMANRQWPIAHWKSLINKVGVASTLLVGGPTDRPQVERLADETNSDFIVTESLAEFTGLCGVLRVLVTTDGGAMHAAATSGVPIISLHGTSSPILLHPWIFPEGKCISILSSNTCSPCQRTYRLQACESGLTKMDCMQNLKPEVVERAIGEINTLASGTCLVMKGNQLMTKSAYLQSWRRSIAFALNYNAGRLALKFISRRPKNAPVVLKAVRSSDTGH